MSATSRKRQPELDALRIAAISAVLICHSCEQAFPHNGGSLPMALLHTIGRLGVPFFLFLTGALILRKDFSTKESITRFYKKSLVSLLVTIEIWIALYSLYLLITTSSYGIFNYLKCAFFLENIPMMHWWYIPTIVIMYIVLPLTARAIKDLDIHTLFIPFSAVLAISFLQPLANRALALWDLSIQLTFDPVPLGGIYLAYAVLGHYLINCRMLKDAPTSLLVGINALSITGGCAQEFIGCGLWYDSIFIAASAITATELSLRVLATRRFNLILDASKSLLQNLSSTAFAVYFIHVPVLTFVEHSTLWIANRIPHFLASFFGTLVISYFLALTGYIALKKMPNVRKAIYNS